MFTRIFSIFKKPVIERYSFNVVKDGLLSADVEPGTGKEARFGVTATVQYKAWLVYNGKKGKKFDASKKEPFRFQVGAGRVIKGWDEGIKGMKEGGKRILYVPSTYGYGKSGVPNVIPSSATLLFEVKLEKVDYK